MKPQLDQWAKDFLRIANQRELQRLSLEQLKQSDFICPVTAENIMMESD